MNALSRYIATQQPGRIGLPLVHVTPFSRFRQIMASGHLLPQPCPVLKRDILYCSYGDPVFRPSRDDTAWDLDPPVALLLSPSLLQTRFEFAPLDTGAIASGRVPWFPAMARSSLATHYCIADDGGQMLSAWIAMLYGGDAGYKRRTARRISPSAPEEIFVARLLGLAAADWSSPDHTRDDMRVISQVECHLFEPVALDRHLIAAFLPDDAGYMPWSNEMTGTVRRVAKRYAGCAVKGNLPSELITLVRAGIDHGTRRAH